MNLILKKSLLTSAVLAALSISAIQAQAAGTITFGEDKYVSVGFGAIGSYRSDEDGAANGDDRSNDFSLDSARIYISGSMNKYIKGMFNTERSGGGAGGNIEVIDANVQFQITPEVAIWAGRFLSPSDRANMAGPYYSMGGNYWANIASRYGWNGGIIGRDDGVAIVSSLLEDHLAISFGAFEGDNIFRFSPGIAPLSESQGDKDKLMYAGRVQYDFWDAEPGYYGTGNYFGAKDILAIGIAGRQKTDGVVAVAGSAGDYTSYSVDFLLEKKNVGPGTFSAEAAYYDYDTDDVFLSEQGKAYSAGMAYLFNEKIGWGAFMPFVRYQKFDSDATTTFVAPGGAVALAGETKKYEIGTNYVIEPYNALVTATLSKTKVSDAGSNNGVYVALQFQF